MKDLAERFRDLRIQKGLTSTALAQPSYSVSYVSQIERGLRRPSPDALRFFARRLGVSPQFLETGIPDDLPLRLEYDLTQAQRELDEDRPEGAEAHLRTLLEETEQYGLARIRAKALTVLGDALSGLGRHREAIEVYEAALRAELALRDAGLAVVGLARAYHATGDLRYATQVVESFLARDFDAPLDPSVATQLHSVLIGLYFEAGDLTRAEQAAERALRAADGDTPAEIRADAFWAASRVQAERGRWDQALELATRARALMETAQDRRESVRLHVAYASLCLEVRPPRLDDAGRYLDRAEQLVSELTAPSEAAAIATERSRLLLLADRPDEALSSAERAEAMSDVRDLERARATYFRGRSLAALGRRAEARAAFVDALPVFERHGSRRLQADSWRAIGDIDTAEGDYPAAVEALRAGMAALEAPSPGATEGAGTGPPERTEEHDAS
jgi:tetratricopeptide (TPR) repeat protein